MPVFHLPRNAAMIPDKPYAKWRHVIIYIDYRNLDRVEWAKIVARIHIFLRAQSEARLADIQRELRNYFTYEMCKRCVLAPWTLRVLHTLVLDVEFVYCNKGSSFWMSACWCRKSAKDHAQRSLDAGRTRPCLRYVGTG